MYWLILVMAAMGGMHLSSYWARNEDMEYALTRNGLNITWELYDLEEWWSGQEPKEWKFVTSQLIGYMCVIKYEFYLFLK